MFVCMKQSAKYSFCFVYTGMGEEGAGLGNYAGRAHLPVHPAL